MCRSAHFCRVTIRFLHGRGSYGGSAARACAHLFDRLPDFGYDELIYARAVAHHLGTIHEELIVTAADALSVVPQLADMYDEPFADSSQIPTHAVSKLTLRPRHRRPIG